MMDTIGVVCDEAAEASGLVCPLALMPAPTAVADCNGLAIMSPTSGFFCAILVAVEGMPFPGIVSACELSRACRVIADTQNVSTLFCDLRLKGAFNGSIKASLRHFS